MKKGVRVFGMCFMLAALASLVLVAAARADNVDEKIRALEDELGRLKAEQQQVKTEQIELRKEATAAAAALPTFEYRPGNGLLISAADKSWALRFQLEFHVHMYNHIDGDAEPGAKGAGAGNFEDKFTTGDLFLRRMRYYIHYCWDDCFYIMRFGVDADSNEVIGTQTADFTVDFSKMNPYFPSFFVGNPGGQTARYVSRSAETSAAVELAQDMLSDSSAHNLSHRTLGIQWVNAPLGWGDFLLAFEATRPFFSSAGNNTVLGGGASSVPSGSNENGDNSDRWTGFIKAGTRPFSNTKNKWLEKTKLGFGWQANSPSQSWSSTTRRLRIQSTDRVGRVTVLDTRNIGSGIHHRFEYGFEWGVGPYLFRTENGLSSFEDKARNGIGTSKGVHGSFWSLAHELFLWSPKGFLTGSGTTANSVQIGWRFERSDAECGVKGCVNGVSASAPGSFKRAFLTLRELGAWYYIRPSLSVGTWWNWWRASNTRTDIQDEVGCKKPPNNTNNGKECDWHSVNLGLRFNF